MHWGERPARNHLLAHYFVGVHGSSSRGREYAQNPPPDAHNLAFLLLRPTE